jgi:hypothetical protein
MNGSSSIDRNSLVQRFNPVVTKADPFSALSIGNGQFALTSDITGLQTFLDEYHTDFPLCTASHWGWHTTPALGLDPIDFRYENYNTYGRNVGYTTNSRGQEALYNWMRQNPHRLHLGRIAFELLKPDGSTAASSADLTSVEQTLDLWSGLLQSKFSVSNVPVVALSCVDPKLDLLAVRVESPLVRAGRLRVIVHFPYGSPETDMADWNSPQKHTTTADIKKHSAEFARQLDRDEYSVKMRWSSGSLVQTEAHRFQLICNDADVLEFAVHFAPGATKTEMPDFDASRQAAANHWEKFWTRGAAIDLTSSTAAEAPELQRRIILSQYLTALHCAGSLPPAETGLLFNSWYGKFHLEMHWWHSVHFTAWNRFELFERSLDFYRRILGIAYETAHRQGYDGCRWPKMVGPEGHDSPSPIAPLLIWQQPHLIYYAELCYRQSPTSETLDRWKEIVLETAEFLAQYAVLDPLRRQYVLGPPLKTVSENTDARTSANPTFELAYWRWALTIALKWQQRLRIPPSPRWVDVLARLSPLPQNDGVYLLQEGLLDTYEKWNIDHPAMLGAMGMQPGDEVDARIMRATLKRVMSTWQWDKAWGWDFPMAAMTAARVGEPELAIQALTIDSPKNRFLPNGHNYQRPSLTAYLPGNGALLAAISLMAAGWTGSRPNALRGFPKNGKWSVRAEGFQQWM